MTMQFDYRSKRFDITGHAEDDHIYRQIAHNGGFYEIDLLEYIDGIRQFILQEKRQSIAIDIGANIGNHSVFLGTFVADHLIAIEPNPDVLACLRRNLSTNLDHYTLFECAVGGAEGRGSICMPAHMRGNIGAAKVEADNAGGIRIATVDSLLATWSEKSTTPPHVALIKIDVEGMEPQVLNGAEKTIKKHRPHIFAEAAGRDELEKLNTYLVPLGYRRMPGHWAATPVYHFAPDTSLALLVVACYWQLRRAASIARARVRLRKRW